MVCVVIGISKVIFFWVASAFWYSMFIFSLFVPALLNFIPVFTVSTSFGPSDPMNCFGFSICAFSACISTVVYSAFPNPLLNISIVISFFPLLVCSFSVASSIASPYTFSPT